MALATVANSYHATTVGTATTVSVSATVAAGQSLCVMTVIKSTAIDGQSVTFGSEALTRVRRILTGFIYRYEVWALDTPTPGTQTVTFTVPTAARLGIGVFALTDAASLLKTENLYCYPNELPTPGWTDTNASGPVYGPPGGLTRTIGLVATSTSNQTFAVTYGTSLFEDDSVATSDIHLAAAYGTADPLVSSAIGFTLGTAEHWQILIIAIAYKSGGVAVTTGSLQVCSFRTAAALSGSVTSYADLLSGCRTPTTSTSAYVPIVPAAGAIRNIVIAIDTAAGTSASWTFTLQKNTAASSYSGFADTAAVITIAGVSQLAGEYLGEVSIAAGDLVRLKIQPSAGPAPAAASINRSAYEFMSADPGVSIYCGSAGGMGTSTKYEHPFRPSGENWEATLGNSMGLAAAAGTITALYAYGATVGGANPGTGYDWVIYKNGVAQDGSGGTPDTRLSMDVSAAAAFTDSTTFSLTIAAGDTLYLQSTVVGTPFSRSMGVGIAFTADTPGESQWARRFGTQSAGATRWGTLTNASTSNNGGQTLVTTEANAEVLNAAKTSFSLSKLYVLLDTAPTAGKSYALTLRNNAVDSALAVTVADAATTGNDLTGSITVVEDDLLTIRSVPSGTPAASTLKVTLIQTTAVETAVKVTQGIAFLAYDADAEDDDPPTVSACTGGGTVASGSNPSAGTSLATATLPLAYIEVTPVGGTTLRFASVGIPHGTMKDGIVESFGRVKRQLCDGDHGYESAVITSTLIDTAGTLRAASATLKGALVDYFIADLATIKVAGTPRREFRGILDEWNAVSDRMFTITSVDLFTAQLTSIDADDLQVPQQLIDGTVSDQNPLERMLDKPAPEPYGSLSDEADAEPSGVWECKHVGYITFTGLEDLGNSPVFLVSYGAVKKIQSVYGADLASGDPPTLRKQLGASAFGDWRTDDNAFLLVPKMTGWPEAADYSVRGSSRWTLMIGRSGHPVVMLAVENRIPFVVNMCARESTGDTSGTMIESGPRQLLHWINNAGLQLATGDWLSIASFGDYSVLNTASFETVHTLCDGLGYECAGIVGSDFQQRSWREPVADWLRSFGGDIGTDRHGRGMLAKLDVSDAAASAPAFTESEILEGSVDIDQRLDAVENVIRYVYAPNYKGALPDLTPTEGSRLYRDPYDGDWGSGLQTDQDDGSIDDLGGDPKGIRRSEVQEYRFVRDSTIAAALAAERLALRAPAAGRAEVSFDLLLRDGADRELGDIVTVTHSDLHWTGARRCQIRAIETDFDEMTKRLTVRDVDDLLA